MGTNIIGFNIYDDSKEKLLDDIKNYDSKVHIISGNPEVLFSGYKNEMLKINFLRDGSVIIPDGVGTVIASKIAKERVKEKIAGIEVMNELVKQCEKDNKSVYLIGATQEVLDECVKNLNRVFPSLNIVGEHNGYFDINNCEDILSDIESKSPYALFAAMGAPRQEIFISKYMDRLPCKIYMGVGGSFDVIAGKVNRAPRWMINLGLEWLYRVLKEPWRIKRLSSIPKFLLLVVKKTYFEK